MDPALFAEPWLMTSCQAVDLICGKSSVQRALVAWAAQYKKAQANVQLPVVTFPMQKEQGKEQALAAFKGIYPEKRAVDVSKGCRRTDLHGSVVVVWLRPNHACMLKVLAAGELRHVMIDAASWATCTRAS